MLPIQIHARERFFTGCCSCRVMIWETGPVSGAASASRGYACVAGGGPIIPAPPAAANACVRSRSPSMLSGRPSRAARTSSRNV